MINERASVREDACLCGCRVPHKTGPGVPSHRASSKTQEGHHQRKRSFCLWFLKLPIGSLESPWCQSGSNLSPSPGLCVDFQSCPLRFVSSPKSCLQKARGVIVWKDGPSPGRGQNAYAGEMNLPKGKLKGEDELWAEVGGAVRVDSAACANQCEGCARSETCVPTDVRTGRCLWEGSRVYPVRKNI